MARAHLIACSLVLVASLAWGRSAHAADAPLEDNLAEARAAETRARRAFDAGDFEAAAKAFAEAYRLAPKSVTKYNEGFAWSRAGQAAAAADAYEAALEMGGLSDVHEKASTQRLAQLKATLGQLAVTAPVGASVSVAHAGRRPIPTKVHLPPGKHEVTVRYEDGSRRKRVVVIEAGASQEVSFPGPNPADGSLADGGSGAADTGGDAATRDADGSGLPIAGWTLIGVGAAALIGMGVTGGLTLSKVKAYDDGGNADAGLRDEAVTLRTTTNVLLGAGSGLAALGLVLVVVDAARADEAEASLTLVPLLGPSQGIRLRMVW